MAQVLCATSELAGLGQSCQELARRLAAAGHAVTLAGPPAVEARAEVAGVAYAPLAVPESTPSSSSGGLLAHWQRRRTRRAEALRATRVEQLLALLREQTPELVLLDGEQHAWIVAALGAGARVALLDTFVATWRAPGLPPPHRLLPAGSSPLKLFAAWELLALRKRWRALRQRLATAGCDRVSVLRALAREYGVDLAAETDAREWLVPFTWRRLPLLSLHAREFQLPHEPPERVRFVGPLVPERARDDRLPAADRERVDAVLARSRAERKHLVYAGFGTLTPADPSLVRRVAEAAAARPDLELVLAAGSAGAALDRPDAGVHALAWAPQLELLAEADVAIAHGGINTLDECVLCGVPMLVYSGHQTDMAGNTVRVVHHGLGLAGDAERDDPDTIAARLDRLLDEPTFAEAVAGMRRSYRAYAEERVLERVVEDLLGNAWSVRAEQRR